MAGGGHSGGQHPQAFPLRLLLALLDLFPPVGHPGDVPESGAAEAHPVTGNYLCLRTTRLLGCGSLRQQRPWFWVWAFLSAEHRHDGCQLLLCLHSGGSGLHLQPPASTCRPPAST
uniref:Transmembrane protein 79b n=1 Tax=Tetraodon nigroviridis TaxID=99883 RepID=H3BY13_TETNG